MTPEEVRSEVAAILAIGDSDPEVSHSRTDALYESILRAIATGQRANIKTIAREALEIEEAELRRWYA